MKIVYPRIVTIDRSKRSQNSENVIENEGIELKISDDSSTDQGTVL